MHLLKWNSIHNHFKYSKLDSMLPMKDAIQRAKAYGMDALAITDHGVMCGAIEFYQECMKEGIKPILGIEIYLTEDMTIKTRAKMDELGYSTYHLILYAKDNEGLGNLYQIASQGANDGYFDGYERVDLDYIRKNDLGKGVVCTSACLGGPVAQYLIQGKNRQPDLNRAREWAQNLKDTFEHFYIELGCNNTVEQKFANQELMTIAQELNLPIVISGDTHYLDKSDAGIHEILLCMNTGSTMSDINRFKFPTDEFYLLHPDEVEHYCLTNGIPFAAMQATLDIANMCNVDPTPKDKKGLLPPFPVPAGYTEDTYLYKLAQDSLIKLALSRPINYVEYSRRLAYELEVICIKGYAGYFLILHDLIDWCKKNKIMTGPGRGSAAGAIVSYLLGITKIDPIVHGLYFERFLDPDKDAFPDIDTDFEYLRRQEVIEYILWKYGQENVAQIITFGQIKLKSGIRKIMKALDYTTSEQNEVANLVPDKMPDQSEADYEKFKDIVANPQKYKDDYGEEKFNNIHGKVQAFWDCMAKYPDVDTALQKIEGCIQTYGVHASGVVIAPAGKLMNSIPTKKFDSAPLPVCQFDMEMLDFCKALKLDVLGLKTLSIIDIACNLAGVDKATLDIENYDDYPEVYQLLRDGFTKQIFQLSSPGMTRMVQDMKLESFTELTDACALYRPGPLTAKDDQTGLTMVESYIDSKVSNKAVSIHPDLDGILAESKGCIIYQEQLMKIAQQISGYTLGQADSNIRKPVGKKKVKEFPKIRQQFVYGDGKVPGAINNGYTEELGHAIFDMIIKYGGYCFNKSHSACYADIAFKTAYLKKYFPTEFMCAVMSVHYDDIEEITDCVVECKKLGIDVLPPHINESLPGFSLKTLPDGSKGILYGLTAIKGIGIPAAEEVVRYRPYASFEDFMMKIHDPSIKRFKEDGSKMNNPLNKRNEPILILAGCFDELDENRHKLHNTYYIIRKDKPTTWESKDEKKYDRKAKLEYEKEHMGIYISDHPLKTFPFTRWTDVADGDVIEIGGIIRKVEVKTGAGGNTYAVGTIETLEDKRRFIVQSKQYNKFKDRLKKDLRVVLVGWKNDEYSNIRVSQIKLVTYNRTSKVVEEAVEVSADMFATDTPEGAV